MKTMPYASADHCVRQDRINKEDGAGAKVVRLSWDWSEPLGK